MTDVYFHAILDLAMYDQHGYEINNEQYQKSIALQQTTKVIQPIFTEEKKIEDVDEDFMALGLGQEYETPGYLSDDFDDWKVQNKEKVGSGGKGKGKGNETEAMEKQIKELQLQIMSLQDQLRSVNMNNNNNNNNNNTMDDKQSFEKWYKNHIQLPEYYGLFVNAGYDSLIAISSVSDDDLKDIGVD